MSSILLFSYCLFLRQQASMVKSIFANSQCIGSLQYYALVFNERSEISLVGFDKWPRLFICLSLSTLQLRSLSSPGEIAQNEDILRIFLMACEVKTVKLSVIGLSCLQKLISHDAVAPSALYEILSTLKDVSSFS